MCSHSQVHRRCLHSSQETPEATASSPATVITPADFFRNVAHLTIFPMTGAALAGFTAAVCFSAYFAVLSKMQNEWVELRLCAAIQSGGTL
jgi:hypothetical protein